MSAEQDPAPRAQHLAFEAKWELNQYVQPALVNQIAVVQGPSTQFGQDGIYYLMLGHVMPPTGEIDMSADGVAELSVIPAGQFAMTVERLRELQRILSTVIADVEGGQPGADHH